METTSKFNSKSDNRFYNKYEYKLKIDLYFRKTVLNFFIVIMFYQLSYSQQYEWEPSGLFPNPPLAINIYCLDLNLCWCSEITAGGVATTSNYPYLKSTDCGNTWINLGPTPIGTVYSIAQDCATLGTQYVVIRDGNTNNNGLFRHHNTYGWQLRACGGLDVRSVINRNGTVLCGVRGNGKGIYRSTNDGDSFTQIYNYADIYCFYGKQNNFWAGGNYASGAGIVLHSTGFPFDTWNEVGYFNGWVIGITVTNAGNIFVATHQGYLYRSINGGDFEICQSAINWDELKIPLICTSDGKIYYGDYQNGTFYSHDNGTSWLQINQGLSNTHVIDLAVDPCNDQVYAALGGSLSNHIYKLNEEIIYLNLKIFLEGPFNSTEMIPFLNTFGYLPLSQPYNKPPWNYSGTENVTSIPNSDIIDWVLLELRETTGDASTATSDSIIAQQAAFLSKNGNIIGLDGNSPVQFSLSINDNLYAIVWHRNHLGIMSANPLTKSGGTYSYDFTIDDSQAHGGTLAQKEVAPGIWGMFCGDGDANGQIGNLDKNDVWIPQAGNSGYYPGDFSMNGQVDNIDKNDYWVPNSGSGSQVPDFIPYKCMVPE
ncbi:MAG: hypothetical protein K8R58_14975 [Bacteroidales bacterium]|nr:hypothetical protein [Bacteroidales bacterium]